MTDTEFTLHGLVEAVYKKHADKQAVLYDTGEWKTGISYREIWDLSSQVKKMLCGRENEIVGLCVKIDHRMPAILLGILRCHAAFYNFDVQGFKYAAQVLEDVGSQVVVIHQDFVKVIQDQIQEYGGISKPLRIPGLEGYILVTFSSIERKKHPAGLAYCITTSGTTGKPKVVMVPHPCITPNILRLRQLFSLTSADLFLAATALTFDPSIVEIFMTLSVGACLLVVPPAVKMMPDLLLEIINKRNKVNVMQITPILLSRFNTTKLSQTLLGDNSVLRVVALGGEKFPSCTWLHSVKSAKNRTKFYNLYGTTEVSCWSTCYQVTEDDFRNGAEIPLGEPLQDTVVEVRDEDGTIVAEGEGRLWTGGWRRQCLLGTREELLFDRPVLRDTGDIVRVGRGGKLFYIGRKDRQKKRHGRRIDLEEIKMVVQRQESVHDCEVMRIGDELVLFMVSSPDPSIEVKVIEAHMKGQLPSHWWPDSVLYIPRLPITQHGKVDFKSLGQIYRERQNTSHVTDIVGCLRSKWKEFTNQNPSTPIQKSENFILAGGDSLKAVQLANIIETSFNLHMPLLIDALLNKSFDDVKQYLTEAMENHGKQCNNFEDSIHYLNDKEIQKVISEKGTTSSFKVKKLGRGGDNENEMSTSFKDKNVTVSKKRKLPVGQKTYKFAKFINDFQFSIGRCNKILKTNFGIKNAESHLDSGVNAYDNKGFYCERKDNSNVQECCDLKVEEVWRYDTGKCVDASPLFAVKTSGEFQVVIGSHSHRLAAICGSTGEKQWELTLPDRIESSACLSLCGNFVIVGCYDGIVHILHVDTGDIWWQFDTGSHVKCSPVVDPQTGLVYTGSHSQTVYCLNVDAREVIWQRNLESGSIFSSPTIGCEPNHLYVATLGGKMFAVNPASGVTIWEYSFLKPVFSSPGVTDLGVTVGCTDNHLYHLDSKGNLLWKFRTSGHIFSSPSVFKCRRSTPETVRTTRTQSLTQTTISATDPVTTAAVEAIASSSTEETSEKDCNEDCEKFQSVCEPYENIMFGSHDKCLYCISSAGDLVWKLEVDSEVYASPFQCYINVNNCDIKTDVHGAVNTDECGSGSEYFAEAQSSFPVNKSVTSSSHEVFKKRCKGETRISENEVNSTCTAINGIIPDFVEDEIDLSNEFNIAVSDEFKIKASDEFKIKVSDEFKIKASDEFKIKVSDEFKIKASDEFKIKASDEFEMKELYENRIEKSKECNIEKSNKLKLQDSTEYEIDKSNEFEVKISDELNVEEYEEFEIKGSSEFEIKETADSESEEELDNKTGLHVVVFASTVGTLYIVHAPSGKILWSKNLGGEVFSSPVVYKNTVVVGCRNDFVYCFKIA